MPEPVPAEPADPGRPGIVKRFLLKRLSAWLQGKLEENKSWGLLLVAACAIAVGVLYWYTR